MRTIAAALVLLAAGPAFATATAGRQQQPLPKPTFETGVDIIQVDVHVVDKTGKPIVDLRPEEFEVEISGRKRKIASVQFLSYERPAAANSPNPSTPGEARAAPRPRRMFLLAIDEHSLHTSNAMAGAVAAERFIDGLQPDDLVGLYAFPTGVARHDFTTDHAAVRRLVGKIGGLFNEPASRFELTPSEAIDIASGDTEVLRRVWEKFCGRGGCTPKDILSEATGLAGFMEMKVSQSVGALRNLVRDLRSIPGRKTLVLVSGGLITTDRGGGRANAQAEIAALGRDAALSNVSVFALHLDWSFLSSLGSRGGIRTSYFRDSGMAASGLEVIAGTAGGTVMRVQGTSPNAAFDRVLRETSAQYLLGVESTDADRDGQAHPIRVKVKRGGAQVRSRTFVSIAPVKPATRVQAPTSTDPAPLPAAAPPAPVTPEPVPAPAAPVDPGPVSLERVLAASARYLEDYERRIGAVVLEERYVQRVTREIGAPPVTRQLRSDLLSVSDPELEWTSFRDVFEVDGRPVRDRDERLGKLFLGQRTDAMEHARRIVAESTRYNLNSEELAVQRSIMPVTALRYLAGAHQGRSTFKSLGMKKVDGRPALLVEFRERAKPRIIQTDDDAAASGQFWIDPATGTVMATEVWLESTNETFRTVRTRVRVSFAPNDKTGLWLPVSMNEEYKSGPSTITGAATYSNPRRFGVTTSEEIKR